MHSRWAQGPTQHPVQGRMSAGCLEGTAKGKDWTCGPSSSECFGPRRWQKRSKVWEVWGIVQRQDRWCSNVSKVRLRIGMLLLEGCCLVAKLCPTLCDLMGYSPPGSSVQGTSQARIHALLQGIFLTQGMNLCLLHWQVGSLPLSHLRGWWYQNGNRDIEGKDLCLKSSHLDYRGKVNEKS